MSSSEQAALERIVTGKIERFSVGMTHAQELDPRNPVFAGTLARWLASISDAACATAKS